MKLIEYLKSSESLEEAVEKLNVQNVNVCTKCQGVFVYHAGEKFPDAQKVCPTCLDKAQRRPSIVQERTCLHEFDGVLLESFPGEWKENHSGFHTDFSCYKICVKGSTFGSSWSGRVDIFADKQYQPGEIVKVRVMESKHAVKQYSVQVGHIMKSPYDSPTHTVTRNVPIDTPDEDLPDNAHVERVIEIREYITFESSEETAAKMKLAWATAHTKTTLKGYGRQYYASLDPAATLWHKSVSGGVRSGRAHTEGMLAIVSEEHPLVYKFKEGGQEDVKYIK